jgi:hypothetical protein
MAKGGAPKVARYRFDGLDAATHDEVVCRAMVSFSNVPGITCSRESHDRVVVQRRDHSTPAESLDGLAATVLVEP